MKDFSYLANLSPEELLAERRAIIQSAIDAVPEKHRASCITLQEEIDNLRAIAGDCPVLTTKLICEMMSEKLLILSSAWECLQIELIDLHGGVNSVANTTRED